MKIRDCRKEVVCFEDIAVTELFESCENEGSIYMRLMTVSVPNIGGSYNAVNVETGRYANFGEDEEVIPVRGSFHREGNING